MLLGENVNVRSSANSNAASLGEVKKGTLVRVLEQAQWMVPAWARGRDGSLDPSGFFERSIGGCARFFVDFKDGMACEQLP